MSQIVDGFKKVEITDATNAYFPPNESNLSCIYNDNIDKTIEKLNNKQNTITVNITGDGNAINNINLLGDVLDITKTNIDGAEYNLIKQEVADEGYSGTYFLTKDGVQQGDKIQIVKDMFIQSGSVKQCITKDVPVEGYEVGDKYIDMLLANSENQHIYINVKDLITPIEIETTGDGNVITSLSIDGNKITATKGNTFTKVESSATNGNIKIDNEEKTVYDLPKASSSQLGGIKIGNGLSIDDNGVLSTSGESGSSKLSELDDVNITNPQNRQILSYDIATQKYINRNENTIPDGGNSGQVLCKKSDNNGDFEWQNKIPTEDIFIDNCDSLPKKQFDIQRGSNAYKSVKEEYTANEDIKLVSVNLFKDQVIGEMCTITIKNETTNTILYTEEYTVSENSKIFTFDTPLKIQKNNIFTIDFTLSTARARDFKQAYIPTCSSGKITFSKSYWNGNVANYYLPIILEFTYETTIPCYYVAGDAKYTTFDNTGTTIVSTNVEEAIKEVFQSSNDAQNEYETTIIGKGGTVSKSGSIATKSEIIDGINSISGQPVMETYIVPNLTSDDNAGYIVTSSGMADNRYKPYQIFNMELTISDAGGFWANNASTNGWVQIKCPRKRSVNKIGIKSRNGFSRQNLADFTFKGSNDGTTWDILHTETSIQTWESLEEREYIPSVIGDYLYYRIEIANSSGGDVISIGKLKLYNADVYEPLYKEDINALENAIIAKGGTVTKLKSVATKEELVNGINSIP